MIVILPQPTRKANGSPDDKRERSSAEETTAKHGANQTADSCGRATHHNATYHEQARSSKHGWPTETAEEVEDAELCLLVKLLGYSD